MRLPLPTVALATSLSLAAAPVLAQEAPPPPPADDWSAPPPPAGAATEQPAAPAAGAEAPPPIELAPLSPPAAEAAPAADGAAPAVAADGGVTGAAPVDPFRHSPATRDHGFDDLGNLRLASSVAGPVGLARTLSAEPGPKGTIRFGITGEFFDAKGFPVQEAQDQRTGGTLTLAFTPIEFLDVYGAYSLASNRNSLGTPPLIQAQGDTWLGAKAGYSPTESVWIGADLRFVIFPAIGDQKPNAVGFAPQALGTFDVRRLEPSVPLRVHLNAGARLDGTKNLSGVEFTPAETFALGVNEYTRVTLGGGLEAPLPFVSPFVEYGVELPVGAPASLEQPDGTLVTPLQASPMKLTAGLRVTALEDVSFLLASDIGLQRHVVQGIAATPPYDILLGVAYTIDPLGKREQVVVERVVEKPAAMVAAVVPQVGKVVGTVLDSATRMPVPGVLLAMNTPAKAGLPPVATDAAGGRFLTYDLPPGPVELVASKEGYKAVAIPVTVEAGKETPAEILLERENKASILKVSVRGPAGPVDGTVTVEGGPGATIAVKNGEGEAQLPPGRYTLKVAAEGLLSREGAIDVGEGATAQMAFELAAKPKKTVLIIRKDKILTKRTIQFRSGGAEILPESYPILDEVVAAIVDNNFKKLRVDGHTDNQGGKAKNQTLSESRAASVREYLVKAGIDASRIESAGFGDSRPIAPNMTSRGRAMNRRVEFTILDQ